MRKQNENKLRVFEAFAGIGAQAAALKRMNINYEIVGISDWFIDAIECYSAIHCSDKDVVVPEDIDEVDEYYDYQKKLADAVANTSPLEWELIHWHKALKYYG